MRIHRLLAVATGASLGLGLAAVPASAVEPNPWLERRVMNMAHSGGELEAPMNTLYAFKRAAKRGADMLELDIHSTKDGKLAVIHNATIDETTNGRGGVVDLTLKKLRRYDAAHWFVPGQSAVRGLKKRRYVLRGARYGDLRVRGYRANDFRVPTLAEVFKTFPKTPVNIEIKGASDTDLASYQRTAKILADVLRRTGRTDVIVGSFNDQALAYFHTLMPEIGLSAGRAALTSYVLSGTPVPEGTVALQVPVSYSGIPIATSALVERAHADGLAVHVWFSGSAEETVAIYRAMVETSADGIMPARPTLLERVLTEAGAPRP